MVTLGTLFQILIFVVVILGPTIGTIARKIKAHTEEKRIEAERQRRRIEAIRTGQVSGKVTGISPPPNAPQSARQPTANQARTAAADAARKQRQEQIAELRRRYLAQQQAQQQSQQRARQQARGGTQTPTHTQTPAPTRQPASPSTGQSKGRAVAAQREAEIAARRDELRRRRNQIAVQQAQGRNAPPLAKPTAQPKAGKAKARPAPIKKHTPATNPTGHPKTRATGLAASLRHPGELRRAIILSEILAPPVAMRPPASREARIVRSACATDPF